MMNMLGPVALEAGLLLLCPVSLRAQAPEPAIAGTPAAVNVAAGTGALVGLLA